jgi:hypothetical protein
MAGQLGFAVRTVFSRSLFSTIWPGLFLALFFPQLRVFNNFSALFSGLFRFVFGSQTFIISNFSALFFKKGILFYFSTLKTGKYTTFCGRPERGRNLFCVRE